MLEYIYYSVSLNLNYNYIEEYTLYMLLYSLSIILYNQITYVLDYEQICP